MIKKPKRWVDRVLNFYFTIMGWILALGFVVIIGTFFAGDDLENIILRAIVGFAVLFTTAVTTAFSWKLLYSVQKEEGENGENTLKSNEQKMESEKTTSENSQSKPWYNKWEFSLYRSLTA